MWLVYIFHIISICIPLTQCQEQIDVLKISNVPFPKSFKHAAVVNASFNKEIVEFSFCYRILIESYNDGYMPLFDARKASTGSPYNEDDRLFREDTSFLSGFEIDGLMFKSTFLRRNIPGGGIGNRFMPFWHHLVLPRFIEPGEWFHFCTSYSSLNHIFHKYQDGLKVFSHLYSDAVENPLPSNLFEMVEMGINVRGLFSDLNIYSSFFKEEEMIAWTTSCDVAGGDIFSWDTSKVELLQTEGKNVSFVKMDKSEVCPDPNNRVERQKPIKSSDGQTKKRFQPKIKQHETFVGLVLEYIESTIWKDIDHAKDMCYRHDGELVTIPQNEEEESVLLKLVENFILKKVSNNRTYLKDNDVTIMYWLAGESKEIPVDLSNSSWEQAYPPNGEATYFHPITGVKLNPLKPLTRPDYSSNPVFRKQCMRCFDGLNKRYPDSLWWWVEGAWCLPTICSQLNPKSVICQFDKEPTFTLRGLCKDALMDTQYKLAEPEPFDLDLDLTTPTVYGGDDVRGYVGPKGWVISRNRTDKRWWMTHYYYTDLSLTMMTQNMLPLGRHKWKIENNVCNEGTTNYQTLQLSACAQGQFTCDDGKCLDISQRCNNIEVR